MESGIREYLQYLLYNPKKGLPEKELAELLGDFSPIAVKTNLLKLDTPNKLALCTLCDEYHYEKAISIDGTFYISCSNNGASATLSNQDIRTYRPSLNGFLQFIQSSLNLQDKIVSESNILWFLGRTNSDIIPYSVYFLLSDDYSMAMEIADGINDVYKVVLWIGNTPNIGKNKECIIDLETGLYVEDNKLLLNKKAFSKLENSLKDLMPEEVIIDENVKLKKIGDNHFLEFLKNNTLQIYASERITPQKFNLIIHLLENGANVHGFRLDDLVEAGISTSKVGVSGYIKEINELCTTNGMSKILANPNDYKWNLVIHLKKR